MQKGNEKILDELTSKTNKELLETKKFISEKYFDTYAIKSCGISEFDYKKD